MTGTVHAEVVSYLNEFFISKHLLRNIFQSSLNHVFAMSPSSFSMITRIKCILFIHTCDFSGMN